MIYGSHGKLNISNYILNREFDLGYLRFSNVAFECNI